MYFCEDVDLMGWEPGIFLEPAFGHQTLIREAAGVLTGTSLVMGAGVLGNVAAGMVAEIGMGEDALTQVVEIVAVADATHATVSALRGRAGEAAIAPLGGGSVVVTVVSFRPQIATVGDGLLGLIGVASDRDHEASVATADLSGFRTACVFGVLAAVFRTLTSVEGVGTVMRVKRDFYESAAMGSRRGIRGKVDADGDGVAETAVSGGVGVLVRE